MDVVLSIFDEYCFTRYIYPESWPETNMWRQFLSMNIIVNVSGAIMYLLFASFGYVVLFDKRLLKHPQILENQVSKEITYTLKSIPLMGFLTSILFVLEVRGFSKLYDNVHDSKHGWWMIAGTIITFLLFTDCLIYWIHRGLHHRTIYKHCHKAHHIWKVPTPYASHAFHPIDGFLQSVPYHLYVFCFPMHKFTYLLLYIVVNVWTVSIHDGNYKVPDMLKSVVNGSAHHMDHHLYYNYNYGQYLTFWDRIGGSFKNPSTYEGTGPIETILNNEKKGK